MDRQMAFVLLDSPVKIDMLAVGQALRIRYPIRLCARTFTSNSHQGCIIKILAR